MTDADFSEIESVSAASFRRASPAPDWRPRIAEHLSRTLKQSNQVHPLTLLPPPLPVALATALFACPQTQIWNRIKDHIPAPARLSRIIVRETDRNYFEYAG